MVQNGGGGGGGGSGGVLENISFSLSLSNTVGGDVSLLTSLKSRLTMIIRILHVYDLLL